MPAARHARLLPLAAALVLGLSYGAIAAPAAKNSCATCHARLTRSASALPSLQFREDVHRDLGFTCADCHGGDPTSDDQSQAMSPARGYRGVPTGAEVIARCAKCHSDAAFMHRFAPRQRVDQASEYASSVHGKRLATGDTQVATCASCHGAHGIRLVHDAKSPVFPTNVAATCGSCHSNPEHMKGYTLDSGAPLPTNQQAEYETSVHHEAMVTRNDLSAPTCNDCHGNHGAAPPGVGTVAAVCGTCHAVFAVRFDASVHKQVFDRGCAECHGNHAVKAASDRMLGTDQAALCGTCHSEGDNGFKAAIQMRAAIDKLKQGLDQAALLIARVKNAGIETSDQELQLGEAANRLTQARTEVHTFNPAPVDGVVKDGLGIVSRVEATGHSAEAELRFRRQGLAASLVAILLVVVALGLKIRQIDRRAGVSAPPAADKGGPAARA